MSLVTSCPACATAFHVQLEQLAVQHGDVRCSKCGQTFNALSTLAEYQQNSPNKEEAAAEKADVYAYTIIDKPVTTSPAIFADSASREKLGRPGKIARKPTRFWFTLLLIVLLTATAAGQIVYYQRALIASRWPVAKPWLLQVCAALQCKIELPRRANLLAIDDSDLQEDAEYQDLLHLSSTIINHADFAQAYPLLELTLTDGGDRPLLRRTFSAKEYLPAGVDATSGIAPGATLDIKLPLTVTDVPVAGYRVFVTYAGSANENHDP
jgi:predicted Zn finger-like uncharacterized protein